MKKFELQTLKSLREEFKKKFNAINTHWLDNVADFFLQKIQERDNAKNELTLTLRINHLQAILEKYKCGKHTKLTKELLKLADDLIEEVLIK